MALARLRRAPFPSAHERRYRAILRALVLALARDVREVLASELPLILEMRRLDAWSDEITRVVQRLELVFAEEARRRQEQTPSLAAAIEAASERGWREVAMRTLGVNVLRSGGPWVREFLASWSEENARLISSIATRYHGEVARIISESVRQGRTTRDIARQLAAQYDLTQSRAKLIARTEVAKLNGQLTEQRQVRSGVEQYQWITSGDERVRESHAVLEGKICRWDDPSVYRNEGESEWRDRGDIGAFIGIPGEDFNCRCQGVAMVDLAISQLEEAA